MAMPTQKQINDAKHARKLAQDAVTGDETEISDREAKIVGYQEQIQNLETEINGLRTDLLDKKQDEQKAEESVDELLKVAAKEMGLTTKAAQPSVFQGGKVAFEADYNKPPPTGIELLWNTGGLPIVTGNENSKKIEVDTSSAQPGDYGVEVRLTLP